MGEKVAVRQYLRAIGWLSFAVDQTNEGIDTSFEITKISLQGKD
jgi:hypothetical protein